MKTRLSEAQKAANLLVTRAKTNKRKRDIRRAAKQRVALYVEQVLEAERAKQETRKFKDYQFGEIFLSAATDYVKYGNGKRTGVLPLNPKGRRK